MNKGFAVRVLYGNEQAYSTIIVLSANYALAIIVSAITLHDSTKKVMKRTANRPKAH